MWLSLIVALPSAAGLCLCFLWWYKFYPRRKRMLLLKRSLPYPADQISFRDDSLQHSDKGNQVFFGVQEVLHNCLFFFLFEGQ